MALETDGTGCAFSIPTLITAPPAPGTVGFAQFTGRGDFLLVGFLVTARGLSCS